MSHELLVDLSLIARQQRELLSEIGALRDDIAVTTAIAQRMDGTLQGLVNERQEIAKRALSGGASPDLLHQPQPPSARRGVRDFL